jgi:hypothetical protein
MAGRYRVTGETVIEGDGDIDDWTHERTIVRCLPCRGVGRIHFLADPPCSPSRRCPACRGCGFRIMSFPRAAWERGS